MISKFLVYPLCAFLILLAISFTLLLIVKIRLSFRKKTPLRPHEPKKISIAFFHPIHDVSGEKERLVWSMIQALLTQKTERFPHIEVVIYLSAYTEKATQPTIIQKVQEKYGIDIPLSLKVVKLHNGKYIEGPSRSLFKLLGHLLTTIILTTEALERHTPDYFIDTAGAYMSYVIVKRLVPECKVGTYIHSPFIKYNTLEEVAEDQEKHHWLLQLGWPVLWLKKTYVNATLRLPALMGNYVDFAWANSTFTAMHMRRLWPKLGGKNEAEIKILYPPCGIERISHIDDSRRRNVLLSYGRFTPETNHELQLEIFQRLHLKNNHKDLTFYMFGYCKNKKDKKHLQNLQRWCEKHRMRDKVAFLEEPTFGEWCEVLQEASYGIHTRKDEPFGSAIVEMMAAGLVVITDDSGGPKLDIIIQKDHVPYGFRATSIKQFTEHIELCADPKKRQFYKQVTAKAREEMQRFSQDIFEGAFVRDVIGF